jgi:hypothetical protein
MNNNRSPRRHSHLYHAQKADQNGVKNEGSRPMTIKLNGIGGANNSQVGSSKSDGKSNNADESHPKARNGVDRWERQQPADKRGNKPVDNELEHPLCSRVPQWQGDFEI